VDFHVRPRFGLYELSAPSVQYNDYNPEASATGRSFALRSIEPGVPSIGFGAVHVVTDGRSRYVG
jgi:hypothetical protein